MTWKMAPTHLRSVRSHCLLPALRRLEACAPAWPSCFPLFPVAVGLWTRISESQTHLQMSNRVHAKNFVAVGCAQVCPSRLGARPAPALHSWRQQGQSKGAALITMSVVGLKVLRGVIRNPRAVDWISDLLVQAAWRPPQSQRAESPHPGTTIGHTACVPPLITSGRTADLDTVNPEVLAQLLSSALYHMASDTELSSIVRLRPVRLHSWARQWNPCGGHTDKCPSCLSDGLNWTCSYAPVQRIAAVGEREHNGAPSLGRWHS